MARIEIGQDLVTDTRVCWGRLIIKGTRVLVANVLALLKAGFAPEQIAKEYRGLVLSPYDFEGCRTVTPAQAGIQESPAEAWSEPVWIPAFAGMTRPH